MTVEYLPVGVACNIACKYCYQEEMRDAGNINTPRDWARVKSQISRLGTDFTVFGGEPLLAPLAHLEEVWKFGFANFGRNGVQTNGSLITDKHIELFQRYNVGVGISIDGPGDMNNIRCTDELTAKTEKAIQKLCDNRVFPSIICTIHRGNNDIPRLTRWFDSLNSYGLQHINFHELEQECGQEGLALEEERQIETFVELYEWSKTSGMGILPFDDIRRLLTQERPHVMCVWNHCDPQTTAAVQGINPDGSMSNCGRADKTGINWVKGDSPGFERYVALYNTPQEVGGCKDCRYFAFCKGHCPGTAIDGDWRNRTLDCRLWYSLFERIEKDLLSNRVPILSSCQKKKIIEGFLSSPNDSATGTHGDRPHGDSHGDHTDYGIPATLLEEAPEWTKSKSSIS